jgi:hypothetical protein
MAGNPIQLLLPYVKKYGTEIWMALGLIMFAKLHLNDEKTYKWVYGESDFQRRNHLEKLRHYIAEEESKTTTTPLH